MILVFVIIVVLACIILGFIVLVQNPKGGGLAANIGGIGNQFMGVKQTTDVLEKGTWIFAAVIAILCITSTMFIPGSKKPRVPSPTEQTAPATGGNPQPAPAK